MEACKGSTSSGRPRESTLSDATTDRCAVASPNRLPAPSGAIDRVRYQLAVAAQKKQLEPDAELASGAQTDANALATGIDVSAPLQAGTGSWRPTSERPGSRRAFHGSQARKER